MEHKKYKNSTNLQKNDAVNHPKHYIQGKWEVYEIIAGMEMTDFHEANILKYILRYKYKKGLEDLQKAKWYLDKLIKNIETNKIKIIDNKLNYEK